MGIKLALSVLIFSLILGIVNAQNTQDKLRAELREAGVEVQSGTLTELKEAEGDKTIRTIVVSDGFLKVNFAKKGPLDYPPVRLQRTNLEIATAHGTVRVWTSPLGPGEVLASFGNRIVLSGPLATQINQRTINLQGQTSVVTFEQGGRIGMQVRAPAYGNGFDILEPNGELVASNIIDPTEEITAHFNYLPEGATDEQIKAQCQRACIISKLSGIELRGKAIEYLYIPREKTETDPLYPSGFQLDTAAWKLALNDMM